MIVSDILIFMLIFMNTLLWAIRFIGKRTVKSTIQQMACTKTRYSERFGNLSLKRKIIAQFHRISLVQSKCAQENGMACVKCDWDTLA